MRVVSIDAFGDSPALRNANPPGDVAPDEILIRVHAAGVNPVDALIASGTFTPFPVTFPQTLGLDFAGVVEKTGRKAARFRKGDRVFGRANGTWAESIVVKESDAIASMPANIDFVQAASLPSAAMTALTSVEAAGVGKTSRVLIVGAAGGVGSFAVQFARLRGAHVIATARDDDADYVRRLGAHERIDYTREDAMFPHDIDVLLDFASDAPGLSALSKTVREGGAVVSTRYVADAAKLESRNVRAINVVNRPTADLLHRIASAIEKREIVPPHITTHPMEHAAAVLNQFDSGHVRGKLVLLM